MKKAIAMRCTQENWDSIKEKISLPITDTNFEFKNSKYLTNYFNGEYAIGSFRKGFMREKLEIHEIFNAKIFLDACGNETKPTLKEVKERFKDAEIVKSCYENEFVIGNIFNNDPNYSAYEIDNENSSHTIWDNEKGFAKIVTYKTPKYEITKEQIIEMASWGSWQDKALAKQWFPDVFKTEQKLSKWYKIKNNSEMLVFPNKECSFGHLFGYGFDNFGKFINIDETAKEKCLCNNIAKKLLIEATPQEVETALVNEWKKRGGKVGVSICRDFSELSKIKTIDKTYYPHSNEFCYDLEQDCLEHHGIIVYSEGVFATIVETITKEEAEKLLNKKII